MNLSVIGLGYVGLPLAAALARRYDVIGYDVNKARVAELHTGVDRTGELDQAALEAASTRLTLTDDPASLAAADVHIVTVPTPVNADKSPDLRPVLSACDLVGQYLKPGAIVVFESTVYPGVTEELCGPRLEAVSGLTCGKDFFLGYSPERINPGDKVHTVEKIIKVVAGQTPEVSAKLVEIYGSVVTAGIHEAPSIAVAEAAKVIENAQRDINIAFVNEIAIICQKLGISVHDVLEAAKTKWNFLPFTPGLVGGHCIGVDPYYMAHRAEELGHHPDIILAGRRMNDQMGSFVADQIADLLAAPGRILVLGITFKEDVPDMRNSRVPDVIEQLIGRGFTVDIHDAEADPQEVQDHLGYTLLEDLPETAAYDAVVGAVSHAEYANFTSDRLSRLTAEGGLIADIKAMWRHMDLPAGRRRWIL